jgi:hypothetical protein
MPSNFKRKCNAKDVAQGKANNKQDDDLAASAQSAPTSSATSQAIQTPPQTQTRSQPPIQTQEVGAQSAPTSTATYSALHRMVGQLKVRFGINHSEPPIQRAPQTHAASALSSLRPTTTRPTQSPETQRRLSTESEQTHSSPSTQSDQPALQHAQPQLSPTSGILTVSSSYQRSSKGSNSRHPSLAQDQQNALFDDERRHKLLAEYVEIHARSPNSHLANLGQLAIHIFKHGRPAKVWTSIMVQPSIGYPS